MDRELIAGIDALDPHAVVVDHSTGFDLVRVCRDIRSASTARIIAITDDGPADHPSRLAAFAAGVDDCLGRAGAAPRVIARVHALLNRVDARTRGDVPAPVGELQLDFTSRDLSIGGERVRCSDREFGLVAALAERPNVPVTHDELIARLWGPNAPSHYRRRLRILISRIRKLIGQGPFRPSIVSVFGVGYRLWIPTHDVHADASCKEARRMTTVGGRDRARVAIAPLTRILLLVAAHGASRQVADLIAARFDGVATRALSDRGPIPATAVVALIMPPSSPMVDCRQALDDVREFACEVVVVTHHDHDIEIILFGAGATDVVNLDAPSELLLAHLATARRRHESHLVTPATVLESGMISVDLDSHMVTVDGHDVPLTHLQFRIVAALVATPGRVVPFVTLADLCATRDDPASIRTIRSIVGQLRRTLWAFEVDIQSIKGMGYRLLPTTACL